MRDPARIDETHRLVREIWEKRPDLRLGQLIVNAAAMKKPDIDIFALEDKALRKGLTRLLGVIDNEDRGQS